jgi:hypothetical protein
MELPVSQEQEVYLENMRNIFHMFTKFVKTVNDSDPYLIRTLTDDAEEDERDWFDRYECIAKVKKWSVSQMVAVLPLYISPKVRFIYNQFTKEEQKDYEIVKKKIITALRTDDKAFDRFSMFTRLRKEKGETYLQFVLRADKVFRMCQTGVKLPTYFLVRSICQHLPDQLALHILSKTTRRRKQSYVLWNFSSDIIYRTLGLRKHVML